MLDEWQSNPHVRRWWSSTPFTADTIQPPMTKRWIVELGDVPFGFMQDYDIHSPGNPHLADLPNGARGMDQYIGDPKMLGKGHGSGMMRQRMNVLFDAGAPAIVVDPHPDNIHARMVYERLGFRVFGDRVETNWGPIIPMRAYP